MKRLFKTQRKKKQENCFKCKILPFRPDKMIEIWPTCLEFDMCFTELKNITTRLKTSFSKVLHCHLLDLTTLQQQMTFALKQLKT